MMGMRRRGRMVVIFTSIYAISAVAVNTINPNPDPNKLGEKKTTSSK